MFRNANQQTSRNRRALIALVRRVARGDERAFARLYDRLAPAVSDRIAAAVPDPADVAAITSATFVEAWWLARFHSAAGADVPAWIMSIASRRAGERIAGLRAGTGDDAFPPRTVRLLPALLDHHVRATPPAAIPPGGVSRDGAR